MVAVLVRVAQGSGIGRGLRSGGAEYLWAVHRSPPAAFIVDLLTTHDDLGCAADMLTGISMIFLLVSLVAQRFVDRTKPSAGLSDAMAS